MGGLLLSASTVSAQDDRASAGNSGTALPSASGVASIGDLNAGDGSSDAMANSTDRAVNVHAGTAIGDGSGGEDNIGFACEPAPKPEPEEVEFELCVKFPDDRTICGTGRCERGTEGQICSPDDCDEFDGPSGCFLGLGDDYQSDRCLDANRTFKTNSARCVALLT